MQNSSILRVVSAWTVFKALDDSIQQYIYISYIRHCRMESSVCSIHNITVYMLQNKFVLLILLLFKFQVFPYACTTKYTGLFT